MKVRTRVAPSPTGDPHVGTAYVALINYCFAKHHGGSFILRIEDTDRARSTLESERAILDSLHWCGLSWSEGPDAGGPHGPYRQSERSEIYRRYTNELLERGHAFKCFCTPERLEAMREAQRAAKQPPHYDGLCLTYTQDEVTRREAAGEPYVVRMKVPADGVCVFEDALRGTISVEWKSVDMQVLMKADGFPTYHLANVVDDHLMEITHVIRGEEWISSAPKHLLLYRYFGWEAPQLCHLPLLRNPDKSKLSKRKNPTSILYYKERGYLAEALVNFLGVLIDSRNDDPALIGGALLERMAEHFELKHIALGGPVFDIPKLTWLNGQWIRHESVEQFLERLRNWGFVWPEAIAAGAREHIAAIAMSRIETLADFGPAIEFLVTRPELSRRDLELPKLSEEQAKDALRAAIDALLPLDTWNQAGIGERFKDAAAALGMKFKDVARLFYVAVTGSPTALPLYDGMEILGKQESLRRLESALEALR
ncbi:MAG TPA: glutamate--tRNA ligase [Candidatus Acidoferrales bacterium]|nr:glutamate--tRNA ligase [Candidatus Acidoferrales bacterium]